MTLQDAIAAQPAWIGIWTMVLTVGAVVLPLLLLIWPASRVAGMVTALGSVLAGTAVGWIFDALGYVKLLGLPHLVIWVPVVWFLLRAARQDDMPAWPKRIIWGIVTLLSISLVFDAADVLRYVLGERDAVSVSG